MDVGAQLLNDLLHIFKLLGGQIGIVKKPVVRLPVLVPGAEQIDCVLHQRQHFVAALNAPGLVLNVRAAQIRAGQIDGLQEVLDAGIILDLKLRPDLLDGQLQAPDHIPVLFEQLPGVVVAGASVTLRSTFFLAIVEYSFQKSVDIGVMVSSKL